MKQDVLLRSRCKVVFVRKHDKLYHTHAPPPCQSSLTGMSPFLGDDDMETIQNISSGEYEYPDAEEDYEDISDLAKDFIDSLLVIPPR